MPIFDEATTLTDHRILCRGSQWEDGQIGRHYAITTIDTGIVEVSM